MADEALLLELEEGLEGLGERRRLRPLGVTQAQVDQVEDVETEGVEVVVHGAPEVLGTSGGRQPPCTSRVAPTLVATCTPAYGCRASRITWFVTCGPYASLVSTCVMPSSTASHRTATAPSWSAGGPITHGPASCIAP